MAITQVNIDTLLGEDALELTIGGKQYYVKDIPMPMFLKVTAMQETGEGITPTVLFDLLAELFDVPLAEIQSLGFRAANIAFQQIQPWFMAVAGVPTDTEGNPITSTEEAGGDAPADP